MKAKMYFLLLVVIFAVSTACKTSQQERSAAADIGVFKVAVLYPDGEGKTFDMDYYEKSTCPWWRALLAKI